MGVYSLIEKASYALRGQLGLIEKASYAVDRWGDSPPLPKTHFGGALGALMIVGIAIYAVFISVMYQARPATEVSSVLWSAADGPFPMELTCFAEHCWYSVDYSADLHGQSAKCVRALLAPKSGCVTLRAGDVARINSCYTQLPMSGVRLYFAGDTKWNSTTEGSMGLAGTEAGNQFGFTIGSDMEGGAGMPIRPMPSPLRSGVSLLNYVHTVNKTIGAGAPGSERHEWFTQFLSPSSPTSNFGDDQCKAALAAYSSHRTALSMAPFFNVITVTPPQGFMAHVVGAVGGVMSLCDAVLVAFVILYVKLSSLKSQSGDDAVPICCGIAEKPVPPPVLVGCV